MSCSFYEYRSGDYCMKKRDYINSDLYSTYCKWSYEYPRCPIYKDEYSSSSSGGCYLTSACVNAKNLPDNCDELTTLRDFRDNWLKAQPCGACEVADYYEFAPKIVDAINALPNAQQIWEALYNELILPCVEMIKGGKMEEAHKAYRSAALKLKSEYVGG